ncbi:MAG: ribonuclease HII [Candidatus Nezhaarchaeota archaeon]|nr:ribonuclease HII [Candidatus Nezhaarchaeota archaeon]
MKVRVGVDEAGRGCLIGPLFIAAAAFTEEGLRRLKMAGMRDSKKLTRRRREELEALIRREAVALCLHRVEPWVIDSCNVNEAELSTIASLLSELGGKLKGVAVEAVTIDLFGREEELRRLVSELFPGAEANLAHDADALYAECSAASIVAKVERDRFVDQLKQVYGDFGSGYSSDPRTLKWLRLAAASGSLPPCVRRSWKTLLKYAPGLFVNKRLKRQPSSTGLQPYF